MVKFPGASHFTVQGLTGVSYIVTLFPRAIRLFVFQLDFMQRINLKTNHKHFDEKIPRDFCKTTSRNYAVHTRQLDYEREISIA